HLQFVLALSHEAGDPLADVLWQVVRRSSLRRGEGHGLGEDFLKVEFPGRTQEQDAATCKVSQALLTGLALRKRAMTADDAGHVLHHRRFELPEGLGRHSPPLFEASYSASLRLASRTSPTILMTFKSLWHFQ